MCLEGLPVMIGFLDVTLTGKAKHSCLVPGILRSPAGPDSEKNKLNFRHTQAKGIFQPTPL